MNLCSLKSIAFASGHLCNAYIIPYIPLLLLIRLGVLLEHNHTRVFIYCLWLPFVLQLQS